MSSKYPLACSSWDGKEEQAAIEVIKSGNCTNGPITLEFEKKFADKLGAQYGVACNSGSSANLLMMSALLYRKNGPKLEPGSEVLITAVSWATSYSPIYQCGLTMKFIDVDINTLNIDVNQLEAAIGPKTRAILAVDLLGNPCNYDFLVPFCKKHNLILLSDVCESLGAQYNGNYCGKNSLISTYSMFFSHHLCAVEMGVVLTDDEEIYQIMLSLRSHGWIRPLPLVNHVYNKSGNAFEDSFKFVLPGYNLRPTDIFSAIGIQQIDKLDNIISERRKNADCFDMIMSPFFRDGLFENLIYQEETGKSSWFGFSLILSGSLSGKRDYFIKRLTEFEIETRPIVAGNFAKNPVAKLMNCSTHGTLTNAEKIDKDGFFIGNSHLDLTENIIYFADCMETIIKELQ